MDDVELGVKRECEHDVSQSGNISHMFVMLRCSDRTYNVLRLELLGLDDVHMLGMLDMIGYESDIPNVYKLTRDCNGLTEDTSNSPLGKIVFTPTNITINASKTSSTQLLILSYFHSNLQVKPSFR